MPRAIWKGDISFGLVSIPVQLMSIEEKKDLHFHMLDSRDQARVRFQRVNSETGKEVPWNEIVKGYEYEKGNYIIVDEDAFEKASPEMFKSIDIEEFVELADIDNLYFDKPYYLVPNSKNQKAYVLLREALKKTKKVGVAKAILHTKEYLSLILPHENALVLNLIRFQQEIRQEDSLKLPTESLKTYKITEKEMTMAMELIKDMSNPWKPEKYHDEYQEALTTWLEQKSMEVSEKEDKKPRKAERKEDVVDFISLLKKSMGRDKKKSTRPKVSK